MNKFLTGWSRPMRGWFRAASRRKVRQSQRRMLERLEQRSLLDADAPMFDVVLHNTVLPADVNGDGYVAPLDVLALANYLHGATAIVAPASVSGEWEADIPSETVFAGDTDTWGSTGNTSSRASGDYLYYDVNGDARIDDLDWIEVLTTLGISEELAAAEINAGRPPAPRLPAGEQESAELPEEAPAGGVPWGGPPGTPEEQPAVELLTLPDDSMDAKTGPSATEEQAHDAPPAPVVFDIDGNGVITEDEFVEILITQGGWSEEVARAEWEVILRASQTQEDPPPPSSTSGDPQLPLPEETEDESEDTWNATDVLPDESGPDETEPDGEVAEPPASSPSGSDPNNDAANTHADETPNPIDPTASDPEPEPAGTDEPRPDEPRPDESTPSESGPTLSSNEGDAEGDGDAAGDIPGDDDTSNCPDVPSVSVLPGTTYEGQLFVPIISTGGSCLTGYQIDWGDGSPVEHFDIHALSPPSHVYEDDGPPNGNGTPQDDVTLQVTLQSEGGHSASASANVAVRNVAPTAVHDQYTLFEHSREIAISLLDNDFDATHSDRLRVASVNTSTLRGRLRELDNGWFSYEMYPEAACLSEGATARDHFTYTLMDDDNGKSTGSVTIVILGQREVYSLSMQVDGTMAEENQQGATLSVSISPPAACEVTVRYTQQLGSGDTANKADFVSGAEQTLRFQPGESMKVVPLVPVDDTEVEVNEIYTLHAEERIDPDSFRNYIFDPTTSNFLTQVKILDNEWRFVGDPLEVDWKLASKDIWNNLQLQPSGLFGEYFVKTATTGDWGPDTVRTHLLGVFVESFPPHTLPIVRRHRAELNETFTFHCDPASGYIQPQQGPITSGGGTGQPPLNILLNGQFSIDNSGDEYHYVTVLINADVAAYGTLTIGGSGQGIGFSTSFPWGDRLGPWKAVAMLRAKKGPMDD